MSQSIIAYCPICKEELVASKLTCHHCGLELVSDFSLNKFNYFTEDDLFFIEIFLKCAGNLKETQKHLKISYPKVKKELEHIQAILGYSSKKEEIHSIDIALNHLPIYRDESFVVQKIKEKLNLYQGFASIELSRDKVFSIYYEEFGNGIYATNLPKSRMLSWNVFDCVFDVLRKNGGKAKKGQAMKARLGEAELTLDTVEGYVAYHAFGVRKGESTIRTISALSAILEWADVCENGYGWLSLKKDILL